MFRQSIKKIAKIAGYDVVPSHGIHIDVRQMRSLRYISRVYERLGNTRGAIVECGVGRGRTFLYFSYLASLSPERHVWGFDSFAGFPDPTTHDTSPRAPRKGEWSGTSPDDIKHIVRRSGINNAFIEANIHLVPGFFPDTFMHFNDDIALLHVDVDLYQSYKDVLRVLEPRVVKGGYILFDEYKTPAWPGATKAIEEHFGEQVAFFEHDAEANKYFYQKR